MRIGLSNVVECKSQDLYAGLPYCLSLRYLKRYLGASRCFVKRLNPGDDSQDKGPQPRCIPHSTAPTQNNSINIIPTPRTQTRRPRDQSVTPCFRVPLDPLEYSRMSSEKCKLEFGSANTGIGVLTLT